MEKHIQRFRRSKRDLSTPIILQPPATSNSTVVAATSSTSSSTSSHQTSTTAAATKPAPPGTPPSNNLALPVTSKPPRKLSPFRGFHLRPSHKRARDSPPASLPHSPTTATTGTTTTTTTTTTTSTTAAEQRPRTAHAHASSDGASLGKNNNTDGAAYDGAGRQRGRGRKNTKRARMPRFLEQSDKEILERFSDLVWQERNRLALGSTNPSPGYRWARVAGPHLRVLDRYVNIQPWLNNRVRLRVPRGAVDYINASPVVLYPTATAKHKKKKKKKNREDGGKGKKEEGGGRGENGDGGEEREGELHRYIAMQGPKQSSQDHVWRMVVEQLESPGVIVMLTETHEAGQEKCWQYFPREVGEQVEINPGRDEFGDGFRGTVTCEGFEDTPAGDAIELRRLVVRVRWRRRRRGGAAEDGEDRITPERENGERNGLDMQRGRPGEDELDSKMKSPTADIREGISQLPSSFGETETTSSSEEETMTAAPPAEADGEEEEEEEEETAERTVYHFLFKKWPDFGVPALEDLQSFFTLMRLSREKNASPSNPRVVHCSAGVGRSGTFIALEHLMRELDAGVLEDWDGEEEEEEGDAKKTEPDMDVEVLPDADGHGINGHGARMMERMDDDREESGVDADANEGEDLIFNTVNALREQRRTMVQADAQYLFIYQVMRKLWMEKYGGGGGQAASGRDGSGEPAAKRLEVDPFVG